MILDNALYRHDSRVPHDLDPADVAGVRGLRRPGDFQWVSLHEPTRAELEAVAEALALHPLAVDNALRVRQRPRVERHDDMMLLVLQSVTYDEPRRALVNGQVSVLTGADYVVTVRHGTGGPTPQAEDLDHRARARAHGPAAVVYAVCNRLVDGYEEAVQALGDAVDEVEGSVFSDVRSDDSGRIYALKRQLTELRRAVSPLREPFRRFGTGPAAWQLEGLDDEAARYFRDLGEHLNRLAGEVEALDQLLSAAFDAHVARISVQQNEDMRRIAAAAALVVVPTLIASIYGMNFEHLPELGWRFGYPFALLLMAGTSLGLYAWFRRVGWL